MSSFLLRRITYASSHVVSGCVGAGAADDPVSVIVVPTHDHPSDKSAEPERRRHEHMSAFLRRRITPLCSHVLVSCVGAGAAADPARVIVTPSQIHPSDKSAEPERRRHEHMSMFLRRRRTPVGSQVLTCCGGAGVNAPSSTMVSPLHTHPSNKSAKLERRRQAHMSNSLLRRITPAGVHSTGCGIGDGAIVTAEKWQLGAAAHGTVWLCCKRI
jgi:hypothetical protein